MDSKAFIAQLAKRLGSDPKQVAELADAFAVELRERLAGGDSIAIPGFGNFGVFKQPERIVVDKATGKRMLVPPRIKVDFSAGAMLKKQVENE